MHVSSLSLKSATTCAEKPILLATFRAFNLRAMSTRKRTARIPCCQLGNECQLLKKDITYFSGKCMQVDRYPLLTEPIPRPIPPSVISRPWPAQVLFHLYLEAFLHSKQDTEHSPRNLKFSLAGSTAKAARAWNKRPAQQEPAKLLRVSPSVP